MKVTIFRSSSDLWRTTAMTVCTFASATAAMAHPGHDHAVVPPQHPLHWFIDPQHFMGWLGAACLGFAAVRIWKTWSKPSEVAVAKSSSRRPS